jgi:hypothetical protein
VSGIEPHAPEAKERVEKTRGAKGACRKPCSPARRSEANEEGLVVPGELKKTEKQSKASSVKHPADRCHIRFDDSEEPPENVGW